MKKSRYEDFHNITLPQTHLVSENNFTYRIIFDVLNKFSKSRQKILDIGCGVGTISFYLASKGHEVLGIDISNNAINACRESAKRLRLKKNAHFRVINFPKQIPDERFDLIICSEVIEHLYDDDLALKKIFLLLKPGGIAFISTPSINAPLYKLGLAKDFDKRVGHLRRYSLKELVNKCRKCGFAIQKTIKTEGLLRNFLFLNPMAGKLVRFIKFFISDLITFIDNLLIPIFGESDIVVVVKKPLL